MSLYLERVVGCLLAVRGRVAVVPGLRGGTGGFSPAPRRGTAVSTSSRVNRNKCESTGSEGEPALVRLAVAG